MIDTINVGTSTWLCPTGVTTIDVTCIGGGASGKGYLIGSVNTSGNDGGGGGAYAFKTIAVTPGVTYNLQIGAGGAQSTGGHNNGGDTWFNTSGTVLAKGGQGRSGGSALSCIGDDVYSGGNGGQASFMYQHGAGGGSSSSVSDDSDNGQDAQSGAGGTGGVGGEGDGGVGGTGTDNSGASGDNYGGGGGGSAASTGISSVFGGAGGNGVMYIEYTPAASAYNYKRDAQQDYAHEIVTPLILQKNNNIALETFLPFIYKRSEQVLIQDDFNYFNQRKLQPNPISAPIGLPLINKRHDQRFDELIPIDYSYQPRQLKPIQFTKYSLLYIGDYRVADDEDGYYLYAAKNEPVDFDNVLHLFDTSATLPIAFDPTGHLPFSPEFPGTYDVRVRKRNSYGIFSTRQIGAVYKYDALGVLLKDPLEVPENVAAFRVEGRKIKVIAKYPRIEIDEHPATHWRVWYSTGSINPISDPPSHQTVSTYKLNHTSNVLASGTYNVVVGLYRASDTNLAYVATTVTIPPALDGVDVIYRT